MTVVAEAPAREDVVEALIALAKTARRCPRAIHLFEADPPTKWDRRHADIDALLVRLEAYGLGPQGTHQP